MIRRGEESGGEGLIEVVERKKNLFINLWAAGRADRGDGSIEGRRGNISL